MYKYGVKLISLHYVKQHDDAKTNILFDFRLFLQAITLWHGLRVFTWMNNVFDTAELQLQIMTRLYVINPDFI